MLSDAGRLTTHSTRPTLACLSSTLSPAMWLCGMVGGRVNAGVGLLSDSDTSRVIPAPGPKLIAPIPFLCRLLPCLVRTVLGIGIAFVGLRCLTATYFRDSEIN